MLSTSPQFRATREGFEDGVVLVEEKHDSIPLKISDGPYAVKENGEVLPYAEYVYETNVKKR